MPEWLPTIAGIIAAFIASGAGWFLLRSQNRKTHADASSIVTGSALEVLQEYKDEVKALRAQVEELQVKVDELEAQIEKCTLQNKELRYGVRVLTKQVEAVEGIPIWTLERFQETGRGLHPPVDIRPE